MAPADRAQLGGGASNPKLFERLRRTSRTAASARVGDSLLVAGRHPAARPNDDGRSPCRIRSMLRSFRQKAWKDFATDNFGAMTRLSSCPTRPWMRRLPPRLADDAERGQHACWVEES